MNSTCLAPRPRGFRTAACTLALGALTAPGAPAAQRAADVPERAAFPVPGSVTPRKKPATFQEAPASAPTEHRPNAPVDPAAIELSEDRFSQVYHDEDADGTLWARGRRYKASAAPNGFSFLPFLGSDAPRNFPVHFRLSGAERGAYALKLTADAAVRRDGDRFILDRGPIEVRYDLGVEHAEQSFALDVPRGDGDLVLHLDVETELTAVSSASVPSASVPSASGGGFRFGGDRGGVEFGRAIVLDASGARAAVEATLTEGGIDLWVPEDFLDRARGPIVVDPVLETFSIDNFSSDLQLPDVAYDSENERYFVVYRETFSGLDNDVYSSFVDANTGAVSGLGYVDLGGASWENPSVAILRGVDKFMVVAHAPSVLQQGSTDLVARMRSAVTDVYEPKTILKGATNLYGCQFADVGGESLDESITNFCVAYERDYGTDYDAVVLFVDPDGNFVGSEIPLGAAILYDERYPTVSKSTGDPSGATYYCLTWVLEHLNTGETKVEAVRMAYNATAVAPKFDVLPWSSKSYTFARVSELTSLRHPATVEQYWMIAVQVLDGASMDLMAVLLAGDEVLDTVDLQRVEHATLGAEEVGPDFATTNFAFQLGYSSNVDGFVTTLQPVDGRIAVAERRIELERGYQLAAASRYSGGEVSAGGSLFTWTDYDLAAASGDIRGARYETDPGIDSAGYQYCYGEPNATGGYGLIQAFGPRDRTAPHTFIVSGVLPNSFGIIVGSRDAGLTPNPVGRGNLCLAGDIGRSAVFGTGPSGRAVLPLDPTNIPQPGGLVSAGAETWRFQAWHRDFDSGSPTSNFTNGVAVPFL